MTSLQSRASNKNRKTLMSRKETNNNRNHHDKIRASLGSKDLQDELDLTILKPKNEKKKWKDLGRIAKASNDSSSKPGDANFDRDIAGPEDSHDTQLLQDASRSGKTQSWLD